MVGTLALAACGNDGDGPGAKAIAVSITANGCQPAALTAPAGDVVLAVTNARTDTERSSEFEILTAEPKILVEEFFDTGDARDVTVVLPAGDYQLICGSPNQPRATLTVTGDGGESSAPSDLRVDAVALQANVDEYTAYLSSQLREMVTANAALRDAIAAGDLDLAKTLYMPSRVQWERIEPIAELFPDLDGSMDARADDFEAGEHDTDFTGWHKLEWLMFEAGTLDGAEPVAAKLVADIDSLAVVLTQVEIDAATMVNGSAGLIEEAANGKITGEEERYAKTDLQTFASNVEGAKVIVDINAALLQSVDRPLHDAIIASFDSIDAGLSAYDNGDGTYKSYDQLTDADRRPLQAELATLSENLAKVASAFGLEVS